MNHSLTRAQQWLDDKRQTADERYRPAFHVSIPLGWLNDPNGFCYAKGAYHLFCQYHPYDAVWGPMHWFHWVSQDLVHWEERPIALAPDQRFDEGGCFSGTAVETDGKILLMYTGLQREGTDLKWLQQQCIAESADGIRFEKRADNPVIPAAALPEGVSPYDFRDPKLFAVDGGWRAVMASRGQRGGQLLTYFSDDLHNWRCDGALVDGLGEMIECPDCFELDGQSVVILCLMGVQAGGRYPHSQCAAYMLGQANADWSRIVPSTEPIALDWGLDFYAPQTVQTLDGRRVLIGWALSWGHVSPTYYLGHGWQGVMTIPRELSIENGALKQRPLRELQALRGDCKQIENVHLEGDVRLDALAGQRTEIEIELDISATNWFELRLMQTGDEYVSIRYDVPRGMLRLNRSACGHSLAEAGTPEPQPWTEARCPSSDGRLSMQIFVDTSIVEVFAQNGALALCSLAFPKGSAYGVSACVSGTAHVLQARRWSLHTSN